MEVVGVDGRIILKFKLNMMVGGGQELYGSGQETVAGCCERGDEPLVTIECGKFSGCLRYCVRKGCALWSWLVCLLVGWLVCYTVGWFVISWLVG